MAGGCFAKSKEVGRGRQEADDEAQEVQNITKDMNEPSLVN